MKVYYIECKKCGKLSPLASYFYRKEDLQTIDYKNLCIWCIRKQFKEALEDKQFKEDV